MYRTSRNINTPDVYPPLVPTYHRRGGAAAIHTSTTPRREAQRFTRSKERPRVKHEQKQYHRPRLRTTCSHRPTKGNAKAIPTSRTPRGEAPRVTSGQERPEVQHDKNHTTADVYPPLVPTYHRRVSNERYIRAMGRDVNLHDGKRQAQSRNSIGRTYIARSMQNTNAPTGGTDAAPGSARPRPSHGGVRGPRRGFG